MEKAVKKIKIKRAQVIQQIVIRGIVLILSALIIIPLWFILTTSFSTEVAYLKYGVTFWPRTFSLAAYKKVFGSATFFPAMGNSVIISFGGSILSLIATALMAYPLSKRFLPGRRIITFITYISGIFNGGLIPTWLVLRMLRLTDTLWALILSLMMMPWLIIMLRNFFQNIPGDIEDAARIDGCSPFRLFVSIALPLSMPALATVFLYYTVFKWNEWTYAIAFISDRSKWPLQVFLRDVLIQGSTGGDNGLDPGGVPSETYKMANVMLSMVPILLIYPFIHRFFVKGLTMGAVKG